MRRLLVITTEVVGRKAWNSSVALFVAISQVSTWYLCAWRRCVCVHRAMALIGNARQAMREGKCGPVETELTGKADTSCLYIQDITLVCQSATPCTVINPENLVSHLTRNTKWIVDCFSFFKPRRPKVYFITNQLHSTCAFRISIWFVLYWTETGMYIVYTQQNIKSMINCLSFCKPRRPKQL